MKIAKTNLTLIAILVIGLILRLYNLIAVSLWHDEAFSALLIRYPFGEMIARIILDVHPPLYYIILRVWDILLGDSLLSLRLFSAFFGVLTIYFTYLFVKTAFKNEKLSLISAAFIAINPFQIQYATEARMYTLGTFLIVLSSWLLAKAIETRSASEKEIFKNAYLTDEKSTARGILAKLAIKIKKYKWWILYGISAALAIYTHYYLIFSVAAQALF
ncbi:MAG: glycosyltransferase family 39 protein, partial [Patescibacteria group bacterium]